MHNNTLAELAADLRAKKFSSEELTRGFLGRLNGTMAGSTASSP